jgi:hypothetical protein
MFHEVRNSAVGVAGVAGTAVVGTGLVLGLSWGMAATMGLSIALLTGLMTQARHRAERQIRNAEDSVMMFSLLGSPAPPLGTWTIEGDFGQLIAREMTVGRQSVVECGSGVTTLIVATYLRANSSGRLYSLEHDPTYADYTAKLLEASGLSAWVEIIVAPLVRQSFGPITVEWYDPSAIARHLPAHVDLLLVDGPPSRGNLARWPVVEVLNDRLTSGAVILVDDGRRRRERLTAFHWESAHTDFQLYWHDTVKGSWKLVKLAEPRREGRVARISRGVVRSVYPRPTGFGRWPVRR